jgi:hypothetical protein
MGVDSGPVLFRARPESRSQHRESVTAPPESETLDLTVRKNFPCPRKPMRLHYLLNSSLLESRAFLVPTCDPRALIFYRFLCLDTQ